MHVHRVQLNSIFNILPVTETTARIEGRHAYRSLIVFAAGGILLMAAAISQAFENLKPAQQLVYERDHLRATDSGQVLNYRFVLSGVDIDAVDDTVSLNINAKVDEVKRDVSIDFLSGEHRMILPEFAGHRGNPIIIAMLEYSAQFIGRETGGGTLYFRNRIRDGLAGDIPIETGTAKFDGNSIDVHTISFEPFKTDANLSGAKQIQRLVYSMTLSDDVPGGVLDIRFQSKDDDDSELMTSVLSFENVSAATQ